MVTGYTDFLFKQDCYCVIEKSAIFAVIKLSGCGADG